MDQDDIINITSLNYPINYSNNDFGMWNFRAPEGFVFSIFLQSLEIADDVLYIGDAAEQFSKDSQSCSRWFSFGDQSEFSNFTSKSSSITIMFTSNDSNTGKGFSIRLEVIRPDENHIYEAGKIGNCAFERIIYVIMLQCFFTVGKNNNDKLWYVECILSTLTLDR